MNLNLDYWQKKLYLNHYRLKKTISTLPLGRKIGFVLLLFILASYPGQNYWQTLTIDSQPSRVKAATISVEDHPVPINDDTDAPTITAQSAYIFEPDSGTILFKKNPDTRLHPASTTKVMTALVALDVYQLDDVLTVKTGEQAIGSSSHLATGQQFTVKDLLYATLVSSGNDAALTLAENYPDGGYVGFLKHMNDKAKDLHLDGTTFNNVSGIESFDHKTTVRDLALLAKEAVKNPIFAEVVSTPRITITDTTGESEYLLETTNQLLGKVDGLIGLKTGWTENAGECLITYTERNGKKIITVVLNSTDRFGESESLIDWAFNHHTWQEI